MILWLMMFGEFTVKAQTGEWIDYARSGRLSENRYLLVEHVGAKGDYDQGSRFSILDGAGQALYTIPEAEDAWILLSKVAGDEDLYLYQTRLKPEWRLWHPTYGERVLEGAKILGRQGLRHVAVSESGTIYFLNQHEGHTEIEEVSFLVNDVASLFEKERIPMRRQSHRMKGLPDYAFAENGFLLHFLIDDSGKPSSSYFHYRFDEIDDQKLALVDVGLPFTAVKYWRGWLTLTSQERGGCLVLHDGEKAWLAVPSGKSPLHRAYERFIHALGHGYVAIEGKRMAYVEDGRLHELDLEAYRFNTYRLAGRWRNLPGLARPDLGEITTVDDRTFQVVAAGAAKRGDLERIDSLEIPPAFRTFPPLEREIKEAEKIGREQ